jgi:hypothetical protein
LTSHVKPLSLTLFCTLSADAVAETEGPPSIIEKYGSTTFWGMFAAILVSKEVCARASYRVREIERERERERERESEREEEREREREIERERERERETGTDRVRQGEWGERRERQGESVFVVCARLQRSRPD